MAERSDTSPAAPGDEIAATYRAYYTLLEYVAVQKFGVPDVDAADIIHEVVLAYIRGRARIHDERAWLVGAMCNACRGYRRARVHDEDRRAGQTEVEGELICAPDDVAQRVDVSSLLRRIPRRCRELLRLRFCEEYSSEELATHYATTINYARKMVYRCVSAARRVALKPGRGQQ